MIDIHKTILEMGYSPYDLTYGSGKKVWAICDKCGIGRWLAFHNANNVCNSCSKKGVKHTDERKKNQSINHADIRGEKNPNYKGKIIIVCEQCGAKFEVMPFEKHRRFCSLKCHWKYNIGINNTNYDPNISHNDRIIKRIIPGYNEWRGAVFARDNYTCCHCNTVSNGNIVAHHIEGYNNNPTLRTTVSNGVTLCIDCHNDFHHQYGKGNNSNKQFKEFMENMTYEQ